MNKNSLRNPLKRRNLESENSINAGSVLEEISDQQIDSNVSGGYDSNGLGNQGKKCSWTLECQAICNWISWGPNC